MSAQRASRLTRSATSEGMRRVRRPVAFDLCGGFIDLFLAARGGDHISPGFGEAHCHAKADAGGSADNDLQFFR